MSRLRCESKVVGAVQTNCYFLYDEESGECLIVDPGDEAERIIAFVKERDLKPSAILLTHGHFDHVLAVEQVRGEWNVPVYASEKERELMADSAMNVSAMFGAPVCLQADEWLADGQELTMLGQAMRCIWTPGHTSGGMCYYFPKAGILFSGDTLFQESVGRTDFPTGSTQTLIRSIREKLFSLPEAVQVYPGHGPMTSIQSERMFNPFAVD